MKQKACFFAFSVIAGAILSAISCTPESCFEETNAFLKAYFYSSQTEAAAPPDSLTIYGLNMSSAKIYNKAVKKQSAMIPLNASTGSCTFIIRINGITDTVTFTYSSFPHLISKECGYTFYHNIDTSSYTNNSIEKIIIRKNPVTILNEENIRIFY
jgi:hypothetical protein